MLAKLDPNLQAPLNLMALMLNLGVGTFFSIILGWHFIKFSSVLSNRREFANVLPFVILTTILIITVVKSSLALSLGLVGALSIVRFRTPIKEPEELAYLFMSIALGLGLGADQTIPTSLSTAVILLIMTGVKSFSKKHKNQNLYLSLSLPSKKDRNSGEEIEKLGKIIREGSLQCDVRRVDCDSEGMQGVYFVQLGAAEDVSRLINSVKASYPEASISFIDQNRLPSV